MTHSPTLRVIRIVEYISGFTDKGVILSDIVRDLDIPKTTVFNIINTLVEEQVIEEVGESIKRFRLGFQAYVLAKRYVEKMTLIDIAAPVLKELSDLTNLTSFIAKQDKSRVFYVFKYEPENAKKTVANIGSASFINTTSLGKAYLMSLKNGKLKSKINEIEMNHGTKYSITDKDLLYKDIQASKKAGYAVDNQENIEGLICFGAPLFNEFGEYEASISISGQFQTEESKELYGKLIRQAAMKINSQLGYRKGELL